MRIRQLEVMAEEYILEPNLVLYAPLWKRDGASFMSDDHYGHSCSVTGAVWTPQGRSFDGTDDYINCGTSAAFNATTELTLIAWVAPADVTPASTKMIIAKYNTNGDQRSWELELRTDGKLGVSFGDPSDGTYEGRVDSDVAVFTTDNEWVYVAMSFHSGTVVLYKNGSLISSHTVSGAVPASLFVSTTPVFIAFREGYNRYLAGKVGDCFIYNRALEPSEIHQNYLATKWRYQ